MLSAPCNLSIKHQLTKQASKQASNRTVYILPFSLKCTHQNEPGLILLYSLLTLSKYAFRDGIIPLEKLRTVRLSCACSPTVHPHLGKWADARIPKPWRKIQSLMVTSLPATFIDRSVKLLSLKCGNLS